jgi:hypothetical protein
LGRKPPEVSTNGHTSSLHVPGVYRRVLQRVCRERAETSLHAWAWRLATDDPGEKAALDQRVAARAEELITQQRGEPLVCQGYQLPKDLPKPFGGWSGRYLFVVDPTDVITRRPTRYSSAD